MRNVRTRDSVKDPSDRLHVKLWAGFSGRLIGILLLLYLGRAIWGIHDWYGGEDEGRGRDRAGYLQNLGGAPQLPSRPLCWW